MAGFYRYKFDNLTVGSHVITYTASDGVTYSKTVVIKPFCTNDRYLKYLDKNGMYRFFVFNKYYEIKGAPKAIGTINKVVENIQTAQSKVNQIGYTNEKGIDITADAITLAELNVLSQIYDSPRVYLYVGSGGDELKDWLQVSIKPKNALYRKKKGNSYMVELTVTLPEINTVKML
jgi:hypothetical protein